ncbi:hypothetical protein EPUS_02790 [Endocarpon pusillum Z07020]|uniref:Alpha-1,3-mannosyltransferase CMT1 n=1 Tax=Endocarpon pusillum (strain Z07020 / HMAS-L-300199) TaxID=1263415 RepID=U1HHK1_ENDPU|nr:uncharacterized protein EPUS_02790 [Endocarpon pusillum Z07020]ERF68334.1 hypothetical protein EPUS_02790 [Endocarpon pusillum Z07020]
MMLLTTTSNSPRARAVQFFLRWRAFQAFLVILIFLNLLAFLPPRTYATNFEQEAQTRPSNLSAAHEARQHIGRVFIASLLKDNEDLLKGGWSDAVVNLTRALGPENVWVSIHESGSRDGTKRELQVLDLKLSALGVGHKINMGDIGQEMDDIIPEDGPGWITAEGRRLMRRIPWLAGLRNKSIEPLTDLVANNVTFDKILFLNDIIFTSDDALELLGTRDGDYAAACGFDYSRPWPTAAFYDQFATRDSSGQELISLYHPYFAEGRSRDAMLQGSLVPAKSCWSGIAAFDAAPFQNLQHPLRFRAVNDSLAEYFLEASECCLIHYDNPLSIFKGVWMNPKVRVGYNGERYDAVHRPQNWPSTTETTLGLVTRVFARILQLTPRPKLIDQRYDEWAEKSMYHTEIGSDCLVNKMMVVSGKGQWSAVRESS